MTAYEGVNVILPRVSIPAERPYEFETPRQFLLNISKTFPHKKVAFDHSNPLLLVLFIRYFTQGIFVSDRYGRSLLEQNLILNDCYPLATIQEH
jgi:hypothetical protein